MSRDIQVSAIEPDPGQPRRHLDEESLDELAQSMDQDDLIQPIMVRPVEDRYIIVHGERRWRAAVRLGWDTIRAEVRDLSADAARWLALVENVQREDLNPIEEALAYQERLETGLSQQELAQRIGKSQSYIAHKLRLLKLPTEVQEALISGRITEGHARQLLTVADPELQVLACRRAAAEGWTVRRTGEELSVRALFGNAWMDAMAAACPGLRVTRTGLRFPEGTTKKEWRRVGALLGAAPQRVGGGTR